MSPAKKTPKAGTRKIVKKNDDVIGKNAAGNAVAVSPAAQKSILLVEDEVPLAHALELKLKNDGFVVKTVANGSDALEQAKKGGYQLMLLDLIMPLMDGFSVLSELKSRKIALPVIVLSNLGQEEDRAKAKSLGALDYFVKSNTPISDIIARVKQVI
jgi:DNA-binding response OmpR family regulator